MASSAPAASIGLTIAPLVAATAYGSGAVIALTALPMLVIASAYRRLNRWNANTGASFEWVGRAINPYLGFLTGWLMIAAYVIATVSGVEVLGPSILAVFGANSASTWANILIGTAVGVIVLVIAIVGIKITARTQVGMAVIEYAVADLRKRRFMTPTAGTLYTICWAAGAAWWPRSWRSSDSSRIRVAVCAAVRGRLAALPRPFGGRHLIARAVTAHLVSVSPAQAT